MTTCNRNPTQICTLNPTHLCQILARLCCICCIRAGGMAFRISGTCGARVLSSSLSHGVGVACYPHTLRNTVCQRLSTQNEPAHDNSRQALDSWLC